MKKSVIWIGAGVAGIGLGIPAYAAMSPQEDAPRPKMSTTVVTLPDVGDDTVTTAASIPSPVVTATAPNTIEDSTHDSLDDSTHNSIDDSTQNSIEDPVDDNTAVTTSNTVEDVSGPCDEAEHANDPRCGAAPSTDDNSGRDRGGRGSDDASGHGHRNDG